jgi:exosortase/archaeosortase family protein
MERKDALFLLLRYVFLIIVAIPNLFLFYLFFTGMTSYPSYLYLQNAYDARIVDQPGILLPAGSADGYVLSIYGFLSGLPVISAVADFFFDPPTVFFFKGYYGELVPACIAGAAYYFLLILNLTTPMPVRKRIASITFILSAFLVLNVLRIIIFATLLTQGYQYFDFTHIAVWYFGSTVMVVLIWFVNVLIFRIRAIPVYHDMKGILSDLRRK